MAKIEVKLEKDSTRQFLTTASGFTIEKENWNVVEDTDREINSYLMSREDILIRPINTGEEEIPKKSDNIVIEEEVLEEEEESVPEEDLTEEDESILTEDDF
jgi:hypothetical protein